MSLRAAFFGFLFAGCLAPDVDGPITAQVSVREGPGVYSLVPVELGVDSLRPLRGGGLHFIRDATIVVSSSGEVVRGGSPVDVWTVGDPHVAVDYEGLFVLTAFHNIQQSWAFFRTLGLGDLVEDLPEFDVYVFPRLEQEGAFVNVPFTDNAAFASDLQGLILTPGRITGGDAPVGMNPVVATHEFGHAVFFHLLSRIRPPEQRPSVATLSGLRSLNEGLADVFAVAHFATPSPLEDSFPAEGELVDPSTRDVSRPTTYGEALTLPGDLDYNLGTVLARTFWLYGEYISAADPNEGRRQAAGAAFEALITFPVNEDPSAFGFLRHVLTGRSPTELAAFCDALSMTYPTVMNNFEVCP